MSKLGTLLHKLSAGVSTQSHHCPMAVMSGLTIFRCSCWATKTHVVVVVLVGACRRSNERSW